VTTAVTADRRSAAARPDWRDFDRPIRYRHRHVANTRVRKSA